jgi:hypothetical protein
MLENGQKLRLEDEQKLRLIVAAARLQHIISTLEVDLEYQLLIDFYRSGAKVLPYEVQGLVYNEEFQDAGDAPLKSRDGDHNELFTALNETVSDIGKLVKLH